VETKERMEEDAAGVMLYRGQMGSGTWRATAHDLLRSAAKYIGHTYTHIHLRLHT
jgi:hypothetical protein